MAGKQRHKTSFKAALAVLLIAIGLAMTTGLFPASAKASTGSSLLTLPVKPQLTATVITPEQIGYYKNFSFNVTVINYGNAPAQNTHLFFRQFPGGFFTITNINQLSTPVDSYTDDIFLGDIDANEHKTVKFTVSVPLQKYLHANWTRRFSFDFSTSFDYSSETDMGSIIFLAGNGKILVKKTGFTQQ